LRIFTATPKSSKRELTKMMVDLQVQCRDNNRRVCNDERAASGQRRTSSQRACEDDRGVRRAAPPQPAAAWPAAGDAAPPDLAACGVRAYKPRVTMPVDLLFDAEIGAVRLGKGPPGGLWGGLRPRLVPRRPGASSRPTRRCCHFLVHAFLLQGTSRTRGGILGSAGGILRAIGVGLAGPYGFGRAIMRGQGITLLRSLTLRISRARFPHCQAHQGHRCSQ